MGLWRRIEFPDIHADTKKVMFHFHNSHAVKGLQLGEIMFYNHGEGAMVAGAMAAETIAVAAQP